MAKPAQTGSRSSLTKDAKLLLAVQALMSLGYTLSNTFVNIFLWKIRQDYRIIGQFNMAEFVFIPLTFMAAGWLAKKRDLMAPLRLGILFHALFFILVLALSDRTPALAAPLGAMLGMALGFYWLAINTLCYELTTPTNRDLFYGIQGVVFSVSTMIAPYVASWIIVSQPGLVGYRIIFALSLTLFAVVLALSFGLPRVLDAGPYRLWQVLSFRRYPAWNRVVASQVLMGVRDGLTFFLINLLVYKVSKDEMGLGQFSLVVSLLSTLAYLVIGRRLRPEKRTLYLFWGAVLLLVSYGSLAVHITLPALWFYGILNALSLPLLLVPYNSISLNTISADPRGTDLRIEYTVTREMYLNLGRFVGAGYFWLWPVTDQGMRVLMLLAGVSQVVLWAVLRQNSRIAAKDLPREAIVVDPGTKIRASG